MAAPLALEKTYRLRKAWVSLSACVSTPNYQGGRCGKERPAEVGCGGRKAAAAREEASSLHHINLKF
jgi:hypothetical protein